MARILLSVQAILKMAYINTWTREDEMENGSILMPRLSIPRQQTATKDKRLGQAEKVVMVRGKPVTLKWVESLQCWCGDPNGLLKARKEKEAREATGSPWRLPAARHQKRKQTGKKSMRA